MEPTQHTSSRCTASQVNESEQMMLGTESVCDLHTGRDTTLKTQADARVRHMEDGKSRACTVLPSSTSGICVGNSQ